MLRAGDWIRIILQRRVFCCWKNHEGNVIIHIDDTFDFLTQRIYMYVCMHVRMCINLLGQKSNEYIHGDPTARGQPTGR